MTGVQSKAKNVWIALGGVVGITAILLGIAEVVQTEREIREENAASATLVAIQEEQLQVLQQMATLQAESISAGPTATAAAQRIAELESTAEALEQRKEAAEARVHPDRTTPTPSDQTRLTRTPAP